MTFDYELKLLDKVLDQNEVGDPIEIPVERSVLCGVLSVTRSEHYQAAASGLKPSIVFVLNKYEYQNEQEIEFDGQRYRVIRTYQPNEAADPADFENIELVCEGLVNNAHAS